MLSNSCVLASILISYEFYSFLSVIAMVYLLLSCSFNIIIVCSVFISHCQCNQRVIQFSWTTVEISFEEQKLYDMKLLDIAIKFTLVQKVGNDRPWLLPKRITKSSKSMAGWLLHETAKYVSSSNTNTHSMDKFCYALFWKATNTTDLLCCDPTNAAFIWRYIHKNFLFAAEVILYQGINGKGSLNRKLEL